MAEILAGKGKSKYKIHITAKSLPKSKINRQIGLNNKVLIVTDSGIPKTYIKELRKIIKNKSVNVITLGQGEKSKSFSSYQKILNKLLDLKFDRSDKLIALGGGVVGDITGFCAATYLRGIEYIQIPTSLLAQVDSSVGGKTAINAKQGKNLIGSFYNPKFVLISTHFLKTLPENELKSGFAEVIKHALISDYKFWNKIKNQSFEDYNFQKIINFSINHKLNIVEKDPKENGSRKKLNFGHTIGHALESHFLSLNKTIFHGFAVAQGMAIEAFISYKLNHISKEKYTEIKEFIFSIYQPIAINKNDIKTLVGFMSNDKKNENTKINFTLLDDIGSAVYDKYISVEDIDNLMHDFYNYD